MGSCGDNAKPSRRQAGRDHAPGIVEIREPESLIGYMGRFEIDAFDNAGTPGHLGWIRICAKAQGMWKQPNPTQEASPVCYLPSD